MKLPEPVAYHFKDDPAWNAYPGEGFCFKDALPKDAINVLPLYTEAQMREALAQQEVVMRMVLEAFREVAEWESGGDPLHPASEAIKALEEALGTHP